MATSVPEAAVPLQSQLPSFDTDVPVRSIVTLKVPEGVAAGAFINFTGPNGRQHSALCPVGYAPDQSFSVEILHGVVLQNQLVQAPADGKPGASVAFVGPLGQPRMARIPDGVKPLGAFPVQVPVPQPMPVVVHEGATAGDKVMFVPPDGKPREAVVPPGVAGGQTFMALVEPEPVAPVEPLAPLDLKPWLEAAREFRMNTDFEVNSAELLHKLDFPGLMAAMKAESAGKLTIQALSDKIVLSRMLDNIGMPQMPLLLAIQDSERIPQDVQQFVNDACSETQDYIVKPTHLSNGEGVTSISSVVEEERLNAIEFLESHLQTFMHKKAQEFESEALQSLSPGFMVQPKYKSCVGFPSPLEIRIVTLWGKARMGVWWWGAPYTGTPSHRNTWVTRRPAKRGELSSEDQWEAVHEHQGHNPGFEQAIRMFLDNMPEMAMAAEQLASAVGAPFLRVDFFVGDPKWGLRLNEVAYGSGTLHRRPSLNGGMLLVDDSHAMAQILREGMAECQVKQPAKDFLSPLGVTGEAYADLVVESVSLEHPLRLPANALQARQSASEMPAVPEELCLTPRIHWAPPGFSACMDVPQGKSIEGADKLDAAEPETRKRVPRRERKTPSVPNQLMSAIDRFVSSASFRMGGKEAEADQQRKPHCKRSQRRESDKPISGGRSWWGA